MQQYENQLTWDEPIPYISNQEINTQPLLIYPISMYNYVEFFMAINCLLIKKNQIPDIKIISMSYLDFLLYLIESNPEGQIYGSMLAKILELSLKANPNEINVVKDENGFIKLNIKIKTVINNEDVINIFTINAGDFDVIKDIICYQNVPYFDDSYIDPELEKALKETEEFKNKNAKKRGSLEDQIVCVTISSFYKIDEIKNLTIRKFAKILERVDYKLHYQIYKSASMSGMGEFKGDIDHWMSDLTPDKYGNVVEFDKLQEKLIGVT